jgi:hypothetical protein
LSPRRTSNAAIVALVLGLLSFSPFCAPAGLAAICIGMLARVTIQDAPDRLTGDGLAVAGIVLGIIGSGIWLLVCTSRTL